MEHKAGGLNPKDKIRIETNKKHDSAMIRLCGVMMIIASAIIIMCFFDISLLFSVLKKTLDVMSISFALLLFLIGLSFLLHGRA